MRSQRPVWGPQGAGRTGGGAQAPMTPPPVNSRLGKQAAAAPGASRASPAPSYITVPWSFKPRPPGPRGPRPPARPPPVSEERRVGEASPSPGSSEQEGLQVFSGGPWDFVETDSAGEKGLRRGRPGTAPQFPHL